MQGDYGGICDSYEYRRGYDDGQRDASNEICYLQEKVKKLEKELERLKEEKK